MKCKMSLGCMVFLGLFSSQTTQAQQNQMVNDIGMQFVLVAPGKLTVGKFEPTVSRAWGYDANRKSEMKLPFSEHEYVQAEKEAKAAQDPKTMFKDQTDKYSQFDSDGVPTHDAAGAELPKSAIKKLKKDWATQEKLHEWFKAKSNGVSGGAGAPEEGEAGEDA